MYDILKNYILFVLLLNVWFLLFALYLNLISHMNASFSLCFFIHFILYDDFPFYLIC